MWVKCRNFWTVFKIKCRKSAIQKTNIKTSIYKPVNPAAFVAAIALAVAKVLAFSNGFLNGLFSLFLGDIQALAIRLAGGGLITTEKDWYYFKNHAYLLWEKR